MTGRAEFVPLLTERVLMPLNEIPKYFNSETRHLIDAALEDAWQELNKDGLVEADPARMKLATTIVALASVGETDPGKLKWFALHAAQAAFRATKAKAPRPTAVRH